MRFLNLDFYVKSITPNGVKSEVVKDKGKFVDMLILWGIATIVGAVCGLIPAILGAFMQKNTFWIIGYIVAIIGEFIGGIIISAIVGGIIHIIKKKPAFETATYQVSRIGASLSILANIINGAFAFLGLVPVLGIVGGICSGFIGLVLFVYSLYLLYVYYTAL